MIIWLNGPFGVGKTQTALELHHRLSGSFVCDPEELGFALRRTVPFIEVSDFQDIALWREFTRRTLDYLNSTFTGTIIVPMTLVVEEYYQEIVSELRAKGICVHHFTLLADKQTLLERLRGRGETNDSWSAQQIDRCLTALHNEMYANHIDTQGRTVSQVAEEIATLLGLTLL